MERRLHATDSSRQARRCVRWPRQTEILEATAFWQATADRRNRRTLRRRNRGTRGSSQRRTARGRREHPSVRRDSLQVAGLIRDSASRIGGIGFHEELSEHMLRRGGGLISRPRPLIAPWSVVHTDTCRSYMRFHREKSHPEYSHLKLWHTCVRRSKKKDKKTGKMLPVQFTVRKKIKVKTGAIAWRKGGT